LYVNFIVQLPLEKVKNVQERNMFGIKFQLMSNNENERAKKSLSMLNLLSEISTNNVAIMTEKKEIIREVEAGIGRREKKG
jgi:hypothetical protein